MLKRYILLLRKYPLLTAAIAVVYAMVCLKTFSDTTVFQAFILRTMLCGVMAFFLYQISADKTLISSYESSWYVIKAAIGYWIFALLLGVLSLTISQDKTMWDNIPLQTLLMFLFFMSVGLFEELAFRAIINDAIIYRFREKKYVFVLSAVCSSLIFGIVHIIGAQLDTVYAWIQAIAKILSAGITGLSLLILYWKTRNIWACGVVHGIYDFLLSLSFCVYVSDIKDINYVLSEENALPLIFSYVIAIVIGLLLFWFIWRKIGKKIDFESIRSNW